MESYNEYATPFSEYLKNGREKFSCVITKSQYAIEIGKIYTHEGMVKDLIEKTRPDIEIDVWGNALNENESYINGNIIIVGYPGYTLIELPKVEMLSSEQFESLKKFLDSIDLYNKEKDYGPKWKLDIYGIGNIPIEWKDYSSNIKEIEDTLKNYVKEPEFIPNEVIIGEAFNINKDIYNKPIPESDDETRKMVDKIVEEMVLGIRDWDGNLVNQDEANNKFFSKGFSNILLVSILTGIISIGILVLGAIIIYS